MNISTVSRLMPNIQAGATPRFSGGTEAPLWERVEAAFEARRDRLAKGVSKNILPASLKVLKHPVFQASIVTDMAVARASLQFAERVSYFVIGNDLSGNPTPVNLLTFAKDKATSYWKFEGYSAGRNLETVYQAYKTYRVGYPNAKISLLQGLPSQPTGFIQAIMTDKPDKVEVLETPGSAFPHNPPNPAYPIKQGDQMTRQQFEAKLQTIARLP